MYLLLLVFGGLMGAAGVVLAGSAMSLRDGSFDAAILTPGIVAAAGGLLLIGLGAGLRTLQRIEQMLASRPMLKTLATAESANAAETVETAGDPTPMPLPPKPSHQLQTGDASGDILAGTLPGATTDTDKVSSASAVHDVNAETSEQRFGKNGNGAAAMRPGLRLSANLWRGTAGGRLSEPALEALWPKGPRPSRAVEAPAPTTQSTAAGPAQRQQSADSPKAPASPSNPSTAGVPVLKSGVVNGMSYTLYSDGSIEAQLPEGTLRFGSITELRNHIEQSA